MKKIRDLFLLLPFMLMGGFLVAYCLVMGLFAINRVYAFLAFSPFLVGESCCCASGRPWWSSSAGLRREHFLCTGPATLAGVVAYPRGRLETVGKR